MVTQDRWRRHTLYLDESVVTQVTIDQHNSAIYVQDTYSNIYIYIFFSMMCVGID